MAAAMVGSTLGSGYQPVDGVVTASPLTVGTMLPPANLQQQGLWTCNRRLKPRKWPERYLNTWCLGVERGASPAYGHGETMTTAAMATWAYNQIDQARTELNAVSE
jgi:hypothetical protein